MPSGSCLCGNVKISYEGEPEVKALCHCTDCQKISGSAFSTNAVVKPDTFKSTGKTKEFTKTADSGSTITSYFCPECGGTMWRETGSFGPMKIIKAGVLDNALGSLKPDAELFSPERVSWVPQVPGTAEKQAMS